MKAHEAEVSVATGRGATSSDENEGRHWTAAAAGGIYFWPGGDVFNRTVE